MGGDLSRVRERAEQLTRTRVRRSDLAIRFNDSVAATAEVHVEGRNFYPPMLQDIAAASSSIHINQFGFRPGVIGERFADALLAKRAEGVRVRLVVDRQGSDPDRKSRDFYARLLAAGVEVRVVRAIELRAPAQPAVAGGSPRAGTSRSSATSTIASSSSWTVGSAGSAAPVSRITSRTAASTTSSCV